jgi:hypothetical protein
MNKVSWTFSVVLWVLIAGGCADRLGNSYYVVVDPALAPDLAVIEAAVDEWRASLAGDLVIESMTVGACSGGKL